MPLESPGGLSQPVVQGHVSNLTLWERQPSQPSWSRVGSAWRQSPFLGSPLVSGGVFKAGSAWWGLLCSRAARIYSNSMVASQGAQWKNPPASAGDARDAGSNPESERSPGEGNSKALQYSCLENSMNMNREAWQAVVRGVTEETQLSPVPRCSNGGRGGAC